MSSFRPLCNISGSFRDFELKLSAPPNLDTLILNLKLNFQCDIVMMS